MPLDKEGKQMFRGIDSIVNKYFSISNYKNKGESRDIDWVKMGKCDGSLSSQIYQQLLSNLGLSENLDKGWSRENWRFSPQKKISDNKQAEKVLEKRFASATQSTGKWANQVPTCSRSGFRTGKRSIDLAEMLPQGEFSFYELKVNKNTNHPMFAAIEVLEYGILYRFRMPEASINARLINLIVLAPASYFSGWDVNGIARFINEDLRKFNLKCPCSTEFKFKFEALASDYDSLFDDSNKEITCKLKALSDEQICDIIKQKYIYEDSGSPRG